MADELASAVTDDNGSDFSRAVDNFNELKRLFSRKKKRLARLKKRRIKAKPAKTIKDDEEVDPLGRDCTLRGVLESNLWARKICRDHRTLAKDYLDALKNYEDVEPKMYNIGRIFDKLLGSLKTPTIYKQQISSPQHSSFENQSANTTIEPSEEDDMGYTGTYFSHIDS